MSRDVETSFHIFRALLADSSVEELKPRVLGLSAVEHDMLICTACLVEEEISANCKERGAEVGKFVSQNCSFYRAGIKDCPRSALAGMANLQRPV